jgi:hypothetical protein
MEDAWTADGVEALAVARTRSIDLEDLLLAVSQEAVVNKVGQSARVSSSAE